MYSPAHYVENDARKIRSLIEDNPFAVLISAGGTISHLPLRLEGDELWGHMARANPQWREFAAGGMVKAVFQGPHAYISPAWYKPRPDNVPTWSYAVVHVEGRCELVEDSDAELLMDKLIESFEDVYGEGWRLPEDRQAVRRLMEAITVFKMTALKFDAKFKLNQKQDADERKRVMERLRDSGRAEAVKLAQLIGEL